VELKTSVPGLLTTSVVVCALRAQRFMFRVIRDIIVTVILGIGEWCGEELGVCGLTVVPVY
jgi:hypothetical protein